MGQIKDEVIVIGAGVIGLSVALECQARGLSVRVLDREGPAAGASAGNAGAFAFTDILPLASPGILRKAPGWLLDPLGPLAIRPAYALRIAPWLFRFWRACRADRVAAATAAQTALMDHSKAALEPFLDLSSTRSMLEKKGNLQVYQGEASFRASLPGWQARAEHGIAFDHLTAPEMAEIQPGLSPIFTHGTFTPGWYSIAEPKVYTLALAKALIARGGRLDRAQARAIRPTSGGAEVQTDQGSLAARHVVIAAGARSHHLAATLGESLPLETERGYNTTLPPGALDLRTQVTFGDHGFVVTRLASGIRVGGAVELGGLDLPANLRRAEAMLTKAKAFFPALTAEGGVQWMGHRPSLPDSLPAIGTARASGHVVYAFGHGHLGLTQSAGTASLVADLILGRRPAIDLSAYSPQRFQRAA